MPVEPGLVVPGAALPGVVSGVIVAGVVPGVTTPGVVVPGVALPGVIVPLPAPLAGGALVVPGALFEQGAIIADVADAGGVVLFAPVVALPPAVVDPAADPLRGVVVPLDVAPSLVAAPAGERPDVPTADVAPGDALLPVAPVLPCASARAVVDVSVPRVVAPLCAVDDPARPAAVVVPGVVADPVVVPALAEFVAGTHGSTLGPVVPG